MPRIDENTIRRVHDTADIVDVVAKYQIELKRRGANYFACCPFHGERTPSFSINPERNTYHCFGCGEHGSPIDFVMKLDNKSYPEAIEHLAKMYGIQVMHIENPKTVEQIEQEKHREAMLVAVSRVQDFFVKQLEADTIEASKAREYAYGRWGEEYCKQVGIGYAPASWNALLKYCRDNCLDEQLMEDVGLLQLSEKTHKLFAPFRERVTIPVTDRYGKIIAFTARYIGDDDTQSKYINSSDSPIYHKSNVVFGLRNASKRAAKNGRFIIVEGAPDALMLQADAVGLTETVAALGTTWTDEQFKQLQRYAPALVFLPDADPPKDGQPFGPGIKAVMRNGLIAMQLGFEVSVREIPLGRNEAGEPTKNDPDSYVRSVEVFNRLEDQHFAVWYGLKKLALCNTDMELVNAVNEICHDVLTLIKDETMLNHCLEPLARGFGKLKLWRDALQRARGVRKREKEQKARECLPEEERRLRELGIVIKNGGYASYNKEGELERWSNFTLQPLYHIRDGDNAIRLFRVRNECSIMGVIQFRQDELVSINRFQQRVESLGDFIFSGDGAKLQKLKEYLYAITDTAIQVTKLGWNTAQEVYAFGDGIFADNILHEMDDMGIVKFDDRTFYLPASSDMYADKSDSFQFERSFSCREHGDVPLYEYVDRMVTVFGDNAKVGFAFLLATLFLDVVKRSSKRLALLNIFGRKGSGKTELGTALMSFFVRLNDPPSLATTSMASLNEMLSNAENNLVHLDEYKNELDFRKIELLKQIWGGSGQTKKNMDGDKRVQRTFVRSGVILTGQDAPTRDDALFSRVIHLSYSKVSFTNEEKKNFEEFQTISARGASHLTVQLLKLRKLFEADYAMHYALCKRQLLSALSEDTIEDRLVNNWLAPLAAFHTVETSLKLPFNYANLFDICVGGIRRQNELLKKNSDVAVFWSMLDSGHMQGRVIERAHFVIKRMRVFRPKNHEPIDFGREKRLLFLNYQNIITTLAQRVNGLSVIGKLDAASNESYLRTHPAFLGTKQQRFILLMSNGLPDRVVEVNNGQSTTKEKCVRPLAMVFDYELLQDNYELNLETVVGEDNDMTDDDPDTTPKQQPTLFSGEQPPY